MSNLTQNPQPRSRTALVLALKRMADRGTVEFLAWFWGLEKNDRRWLLTAEPNEERAQVGR